MPWKEVETKLFALNVVSATCYCDFAVIFLALFSCSSVLFLSSVSLYQAEIYFFGHIAIDPCKCINKNFILCTGRLYDLSLFWCNLFLNS